MSGLILLAVVASIAVTAVLTFALWRMNRPGDAKSGDGAAISAEVGADGDGGD
jgi:hypothetical protein